MATWKKIIVSGSNISQLTNDSLYIHTGSNGVALSGSFSGSFQGDGSLLTGVTADGTLSGSAQIASDISGSFTSTSASIASDIVANSSSLAASITSNSSSLAARVAASEAFSSSLDAGFASEADLNTATASLSSSLATDIATKANSASFAADIAALDAFSSSLDSTVISYTGSFAGDGSALQNITVDQNATVTASFSSATTSSIIHNFNSDNIIVVTYDDQNEQFLPSTIKAVDGDTVEIHFESATSGRAIVARGGHIVSGSIPFDNILEKPTLVSGSAQLAADISGSTGALSSSIAADIVSTSSSLATDIALRALTTNISGSFTSTSASLASDIVANSASLASDIASLDSGKADKTAVTGAFAAASSSIASEIDALQGSVGAGGLLSSSAQIASNISGSTGALSASIASDIATNLTNITSNDADIAGLNTYTSSLKTAITVSGQNVTIAGDLEVSGTTTTVDSTTVSFADNIIALNGTGAANGGIEVNDANGPASGSLIWDGTANTWKAGAQGSEEKVLTKGATGDGLLSGSAQIADNISGSFGAASASIATDIDALQSDSGSFSTRVTAQEAFSSSLDDTFTTTAELVAATASLSASLATDIATRALTANISGSFTATSASIASDIVANSSSLAAGIVSTSSSLATDIALRALTANISGSFTSTSASLASDIVANSASLATDIALRALTTNISGSFTSTSASLAASITTNSSSLAARVAANEAFSSSLDASFATEAEVGIATASLSSSLAADIATNSASVAGLTSGEFNSGSFSVKLDPVTGSIAFTDGLEIGDVYNQGNGTTDLRVPNGASWIELNYADTDFIFLDGTDAGINLDNNYEWKFYGASGTMIAPGEIRGTTISGSSFVLSGGELFSGSAQLNTITGVAAAISGSSTALSASVASDIATNLTSINTINDKTIVSGSSIASTGQGEVQLTTNGVAATTVDLGLQTTDSPTFAGLTVAGDLTVTGNTIEAQVTNLNVEDKYILLNSGSTSGDSGIVFGGANGAANTGVGLFWDTSYNSNDGRLGIVNTIAAGATGDQTPAYHFAGVYEGSSGDAATAQADHVGNIRVESDEIYIYV
jgi:hypothetical protein